MPWRTRQVRASDWTYALLPAALGLFLMALTLVGCAPSGEATAPPRPIVHTVNLSGLCLEVKPIDEAALARALAPIPPDSPIIAAIADYGRMRAQARACKAAAGK